MSLISVSSGKLIEYLDNGKFICGYVTDSQPKRVRLLNQNGRELNLPISRIVHCSSSRHNTESDRESLIRSLRNTTEKRHLLMERVDLEMLWELTCEENTDSFDPHFLAELTFGQDADDDIETFAPQRDGDDTDAQREERGDDDHPAQGRVATTRPSRRGGRRARHR